MYFLIFFFGCRGIAHMVGAADPHDKLDGPTRHANLPTKARSETQTKIYLTS